MSGRLDITSFTKESLAGQLDHIPIPLKFGTSGRRGKVQDLTHLEIYINVSAELEYLLKLPPDLGGIKEGDEIYIGYDLRPSSTSCVPIGSGRGGIIEAVVQAVRDARLEPVNAGSVPTPALMYYATNMKKASIMITGSHIPFDRNGYKLHTSKGELRKEDEKPIQAIVERWRYKIYSQPIVSSIFDASGRLKKIPSIPPVTKEIADSFIKRYTEFFRENALSSLRIGVFQHSAVGRDLIVEVLERLGAKVIPFGRTDQFIPIDTENISQELILQLEQEVNELSIRYGPIDVIVSTDGDSDRPLFLVVEPPCDNYCRYKVKFIPGDLLGILVARYLGADAVVVPISCSDAVDMAFPPTVLQPKSKIGSPYVISQMENAIKKGYHIVCGWEANGGFLLGSDIFNEKGCLKALLTRDSFLPIICALLYAKMMAIPVYKLTSMLPVRFNRSSLLSNFPREEGLRIIQKFLLSDESVVEIQFDSSIIKAIDLNGVEKELTPSLRQEAICILDLIGRFFKKEYGFGAPFKVNMLDGIRIWFDSGDIVHIRPSGNADELRIYVVANSIERAQYIINLAVEEPYGILRQLQTFVLA